ncbi:hypothetical protein [Streptomyces soliscabiei]|uniref:hypothetical protein n=1 Tax=Streptomyces soliscabiei TaxID=588897 RepID=UPI0029B4B34B|nr:hypothetical protein [Streptomyces sp. NY05-11A]MDX2680009.1 hypothetical protein [Streptomyces sp. NY05-11A]
MEPAVRSYADARGLTVHTAAPGTLVDVLTQDTRSKDPSVVFADLRYCGLETVDQTLDRLHQHTVRGKAAPPRAGIVLVDPLARDALKDERVTQVLRPERWNADSLRAWPECPFDTLDKRHRLTEATGGWPSLVERTVDYATRGGFTLEAAVETIQAQYAQEEVAGNHLDRAELTPEMRGLLAEWVWLAQNHVLLPLLDDARDQFTTTVRLRARVPLARLAQDYGPRLEPAAAPEPADSAVAMMELGAMWSAHCDGVITLSPAERRRLRVLREARNRLAHRVPLDGDRLRRLVEELCR